MLLCYCWFLNIPPLLPFSLLRYLSYGIICQYILRSFAFVLKKFFRFSYFDPFFTSDFLFSLSFKCLSLAKLNEGELVFQWSVYDLWGWWRTCVSALDVLWVEIGMLASFVALVNNSYFLLHILITSLLFILLFLSFSSLP